MKTSFLFFPKHICPFSLVAASAGSAPRVASATLLERRSIMGGGVPPIPMDRTNPLNPVAFPSLHRLHVWGGEVGLGAHPGEGNYYPPQRVVPTERSQRTISLSHPLCSMPDEIVKPPAFWHRQKPDARVMNFLSGADIGSPRLHPFTRTWTQSQQDLRRATSYNTDFCVGASKRNPSSTKLPPLERRYRPITPDDW